MEGDLVDHIPLLGTTSLDHVDMFAVSSAEATDATTGRRRASRVRLVALAFLGVAVLSFGAGLTTRSSRSTARPSAALQATTTPATAAERTVAPEPRATTEMAALTAPCRYLVQVAADALGADPESYANVLHAISAFQGDSLNDVVHQQLNTAVGNLTVLDNGSVFTPDSQQTGRIEALEVAIGSTDGAPCSVRDFPLTSRAGWPITEPP